MKRPSKFDGETGALAGVSASPLGPPQGEAVIPFPGSAARITRDQEDAGVSPASASSFVPLGSLTHAVVLRLQGGFPKVNVLAGAQREEEPTRRPFSQPVEEGEPG
jgi:hypothetical protein